MINKDFGINHEMDYRRSRRKSSKKRWIWIFIIVFLAITPLVISKISPNFKKQNQVENITSPIPISVMNNSKNLESIVNNSLANTKGTYAVGIINLKTGEEFFSNANLQFDAASLYKLWVMAVVYKKIESGTLNLNSVLSEDIEILNEKFHIASESAEQKEGKVTYSVADALSLMVSKSDNYAALLLTEKIGLSSVANFLTEFGFSNSTVGTDGKSPVTTVRDIADFFYKLQNGEFANSKDTNEMITLLKRQVLNEKIPKDLPVNIVIAHKTGELDDYSHDAGIIYAPNGNYILVVLSKTVSRDDANATIANISKAVFDYFNL